MYYATYSVRPRFDSLFQLYHSFQWNYLTLCIVLSSSRADLLNAPVGIMRTSASSNKIFIGADENTRGGTKYLFRSDIAQSAIGLWSVHVSPHENNFEKRQWKFMDGMLPGVSSPITTFGNFLYTAVVELLKNNLLREDAGLPCERRRFLDDFQLSLQREDQRQIRLTSLVQRELTRWCRFPAWLQRRGYVCCKRDCIIL